MKMVFFVIGVLTLVGGTSAGALTPDREAKCRGTAQFVKMCELCDARGAGRCSADRPNHGSAPKFMHLVHAIDAMEKACGFVISANSCVKGLLERVPRICRGEDKVPDINQLVTVDNCN